ncbi:hypothetical protein RRG08_040956 [Elysia crispata]|uniref:Timeless C-terminal domain-containing protein n=1 Tax=Elysia crispata TaxID=231223 RepID=A0AAE1E0Q2_9GAST|nr:hypothetical protein RRG08_040956 [Elysia crispata]
MVLAALCEMVLMGSVIVLNLRMVWFFIGVAIDTLYQVGVANVDTETLFAYHPWCRIHFNNYVVENTLCSSAPFFRSTQFRVYGPQQTQPEEGDEGDGEENDVEEEEMGEMEASEAQFDFNGFINGFAHINVLKSYTILLKEFSENSDAVNHCVVKMLHRLSHDLGYVGMLFQASIFKSFSSLINGPYSRLPRFKELAKFATYVVRQFTNVAKINKKIFVDMLFWKSRNEALAVTGGYDFSTKSKGKSLWTEDQEEELLGLFEKFRDVTHPELDTADLILGELTSNHTRIQVLKELKRQGVIRSAADLKRKGRSRAWADEEIQELRDAFELHKDSDYPISDIMTTLAGSRSRQTVISKILNLGLVGDKAELKKKRKGGRNGGRRRRQNESDESSESSGDESDDDEDNEDDLGDGGGDADDTVRSLVRQAACTVGDYVSRLVEQGYQEQIEWIRRGLRNAAEDRDEGVFIPMPIVPLSEENETAMEDESFLVFLRCIGITPPANQQELFWRIPAEFSSTDLTAMADGLEVTGSGQAANPEEVQRIVAQALPGLFSAASEKNKKSKTKVEKRKKKEENRRKKMERQKEKAKKKKSIKGPKRDNSASYVKTASQSEDDSQLSGENDVGPFVPVIPRIAHGSDTSDSGLDSALEAEEQKRIWQEKKTEKGKGMSASDRREALQRMMARRNQKRKGMAGTSNEVETSGPNKKDPTNVVKEDKLTSVSPSGSRGILSNKKRRLQQLDSDSDSNTSSLSSLSEAPGEDEAGEKTSLSPVKKNLNSSIAKKRALDSDSDSEELLAMEKSKRQKNNSDNEELDLLMGVESVSKVPDKAESSDKENKDIDSQSQSQLNESLCLHFSTSDEDDNVDNDDGDKNDEEDNKNGEEMAEIDRRKESSKEETQKESFPATLLTQGQDSDDEEDDHITLRAAVKRRRAAVIDSDED